MSVELLEPLPTDGQGQELPSRPPPPRPGAPSRPMWPITFGIAIRRVSRRSSGLKYGRATGKSGDGGGLRGRQNLGEKVSDLKQSVCKVGLRVVWFCFVLFFQFPPPYPQPSPSLISFIVIIINHRPPNRSSGKEGGSWDLGWRGDGGGKNSAVLPEKIRKR